MLWKIVPCKHSVPGDVIRQLMTVLHKGETLGEPLDINISVYEALDLVKEDVPSGAFKIELDLASGLPQVSANSLQIEKVLVNLLRNGMESMQESGISDGTITVRTQCSRQRSGHGGGDGVRQRKRRGGHRHP